MIKVYDQPQDLGAIIFGISEDDKRNYFESVLKALKENGIDIIQFDTYKNPEECKDKTLPTVVVNDQIFEGRYPSLQEICNLIDVNSDDVKVESWVTKGANTTRLGSCCGVGSDIYLDPNEDEA